MIKKVVLVSRRDTFWGIYEETRSPYALQLSAENQTLFTAAYKITQSDVIEIPTDLAAIQHIKEGEFIQVSIVKLDKVEKVEVAPVDSDSWDTLRLSAEIIEERLLGQVFAIHPGFVFPFYIGFQVAGKLKVVSSGTGYLSEGTEIHVQPKDRIEEARLPSQLLSIRSQDLVAWSRLPQGALVLQHKNDISIVVNENEEESPEGYISHAGLKHLQPYNISKATLPSRNWVFTYNVESGVITEAKLISAKVCTLFTACLDTWTILTVTKCKQLEVNIECDGTQSGLCGISIDPKSPGFEAIIEKLTISTKPSIPKKYILTSALEKKMQEVYDLVGTQAPGRALLVNGPTGSGKSMFLRQLKTFLSRKLVPCKYIDLYDFDLSENLDDLLKACVLRGSSIILIDNLDVKWKYVEDGSENFARASLKSCQNSGILCSAIDRYTSLRQNNIRFIASSNRDVNPELKQSGYFDMQYDITKGQAEEKSEILKELWNLTTKSAIQKARSMTLGDLFYFINYYSANVVNHEMALLENEFAAYQPISLRSSQTVESEVTWDDVGGLQEAKDILKDTIELPTRYSFLFDKYPLKMRTGVLLYGPPGCGKTLLAQAVAKECGVNFISVKGPELLDKYIGASEAAVRQIFAKAREAQPAVLFFDEFDATVPKRGSGSQTGVTDRIVNQFLCELDGVEVLSNVTILAATSRPELIDPAILRPGRIDKKLFINFPNFEERTEILTRLCEKMQASAIDVKAAAAIEGFTGADYQGIAHSLQLDVYHQRIQQIESEALLDKWQNTHPSISARDREVYNARFAAFDEGKASNLASKVALM